MYMIKFKFINKDNFSRLPKSCGVYVFKKGRQILYIGKAADIKERVKNHLPERSEGWRRTNVLRPQQTAFRDNLFINQATKIGYFKTDSEIEALILEANLIKKYQPKYNVMWRDDKNYFYVGMTKEDFPRVFITHQPLRQAQGKPLRQGLRVSLSRTPQGKPKLRIDYVGPFVEGRALKQALNTLRRVFPYRTCKHYVGKPCLWYQLGRCPGPCLLGSKLANEIPKLEEAIKKESQRNAKNLKKILEGGKSQVLKSLKTEMKKVSKTKDFEKAATVRDQIRALERVLSHARLLETIEPEKNDWDKTEKELKIILNLKKGISRIEAYDVSNIQGQQATGSMVTFINGQSDKNFYRRFKIKIAGKPNDIAMLKEVLTRRVQHPEWEWPDLILVDGGIAQLNIAQLTINNYQLTIPIMALAKKENKLYIEGKKKPVLLKKLPREIFNLILQLRDEAHRFALSYHRKLREKF